MGEDVTWSRQILPLVESHGIRCLAPSRRGFGRSEWSGNSPNSNTGGNIDYDAFATDTAALLQAVPDLGDFIFVSSSMGAGESVLVQEKLSQAAGDGKGGGPMCRGFIWLAPSLPLPQRTEENPTAQPRELWDAILIGLRADREGFVKASLGGVFGTHAGIEMSAADLAFFEEVVRGNDPVAMERCLQLVSRYDFSEKLKRMGERKGEGVEVVVVAGKEDNGWPPEAGPLKIKDLIPDAEVQVWEGAAHGLWWTHAERVNELILRVWKNA